MVWFQCEDCGENLKKPKLSGHFRICSAFKLSCIDCGVTFGQQDVQGHNQCITEAEKYGPKGQGKAMNNSAAKPKNDAAKQKPEIDTTVGLSERPPWFCKLCNSKATSKQALLLHADGKKHRAKARAFHAANQKPNMAEEANSKDVSSNVEESNQNVSSAETENANSLPFKKRKLEQSENGIVQTGSSPADKLDCGEVIQVEEKLQLKKAKPNIAMETNEDPEKKIKWKKLIKSSLQTNPEGILKMKKLRKLVLKSLRETGIKEDETQIIGALEHKVNSSSRFSVDGKYVHLVSSKS